MRKRVYHMSMCNSHHNKCIKECIISLCVTVTIINLIKNILYVIISDKECIISKCITIINVIKRFK